VSPIRRRLSVFITRPGSRPTRRASGRQCRIGCDCGGPHRPSAGLYPAPRFDDGAPPPCGTIANTNSTRSPHPLSSAPSSRGCWPSRAPLSSSRIEV
jgi:hypothetical protein